MQTFAACTAILAGNDSSVNSPSESLPNYLSDCSLRDKPWDVRRSLVDLIVDYYSCEREFYSHAGRMTLCSGRLGFAWVPEEKGSGVETLKLRSARYCRVRHCPICEWRRSLMWIARFLQALDDGLLVRYPTSRFLFLTLTRKNMSPDQLRDALKDMNEAWARLRKRKEFSIIQGWIRTTEVTRNPHDGTAHPHFHALLMVPSNYFTKNWISKTKWIELWKEALRVDYPPSVWIRSVKKDREDLARNVRETLKYAVKAGDMTADPAWLYQITRQLRNLRFVASGGVLKDVLKQEDSEEQLLLLGEGESPAEAEVFFDWMKDVKRYVRESRT